MQSVGQRRQISANLACYGLRCVHYKHLFPAPLNFSIRKFDVGNGCGGKMPVLMHEWIQVGIWRQKTLRRHGSESLCTHEISLQK